MSNIWNLRPLNPTVKPVQEHMVVSNPCFPGIDHPISLIDGISSSLEPNNCCVTFDCSR